MARTTYNRDELVELCNRAIVSHERWSNRDSATAQKQVGELLVLLRAGCPFEVVKEGVWVTNERTVVVKMYYRGFMQFEEGEGLAQESFYLPTQTRLDEANCGDWY